MASRNRKPKGNPLNTAADDGQSINTTDLTVFGPMGSSGREVFKDFLIDKIEADRSQPRRAIPNAVCGKWDGNPDTLGQIFNRWIQMACQELGEEIAVGVLLDNNLDAPETEMITPMEYPIAHALMQLISLASNIRKVGLNTPISIVEMGNRWKISTGERRWLAHHLLRATVGGGEWNKIKARVVQADVWTQVSENGAREELNAISVARGLALLLMDMYKDDEEYAFIPYEEIINSNDTDQAFYAQAADLRVKRGLGNDVLYATGIKSQGMLYRYRQLLNIPERVWLQADVEDWTEFAIREHVQLLNGKPTKAAPISEPNDGYTSPTVEVSATFENQPESINGESGQGGSGQQMATPTGNVPVIPAGRALGRGREAFKTSDEVIHGAYAEIQKAIHEATPEPVERALESETPLIGDFNNAKQLMHIIAYAAQGTTVRVDNVRLDKVINDMQTMSLEDIRIMISNETEAEDLEWYKQYLQTALDAIEVFVHEQLEPFFTALWDEGNRMRVKYPVEVKE